MTELLKQGQFSPLKVEEQVVVIYAGVNGYLDALPVSEVGRFEQEFLRNIRSSHADILDAIRNEKQISNDTEAKLKAAVEAFSKSFS